MNLTLRAKLKSFMMVLLAVGSVLVGTAHAEDEYRDFEDVEGRIIRGRVVAFDEKTELVTFQRESDEKVLQVKLPVFAHPDRQYIRDWASMNGLMKDLKITAVVKSDPHQEITSSGDQYRVVDTQFFDVQIENLTEHEFGKIQIEYCIFYRQGSRQDEGMIFDEGTCYGQASVKLGKEQGKDSFKTKKIKLYSRQSPDTQFGRLNDARSNIRGIWIKARVPLPSGERFTYEFRSTKDPRWKWTTEDVKVGLNDEDSH